MKSTSQHLQKVLDKVRGQADFISLRTFQADFSMLAVRQGHLEPLELSEDQGIMVTAVRGQGLGYGATADLSEAGIQAALAEAIRWADVCGSRGVYDFSKARHSEASGEFQSKVEKPWDDIPMDQRLDLLHTLSKALGCDPKIVDWQAGFMSMDIDSAYYSTAGAGIEQSFQFLVPFLEATAHHKGVTEVRSLAGRGFSRQGGFEIALAARLEESAGRVAQQAMQLVEAPHCPTGTMDIVLSPDQMMLQIHESIGHPLELDRILGDERNYAGTSFVTPDMFGSYQYGSDKLNITFDPKLPGEFASYAFDDEGAPAERAFLIKEGRLERGLGGQLSQERIGLSGVSCSRSNSWNRPPIDRMGNINLEPGTASLDDMIGQVERGVYMETNCSWSIDDSRNKFQFGCEFGRLIENGKLTSVVRKPNYRGISANFWRNLKEVGHQDTFELLGTPYCGKGEPNQVIWVGHASPACLFSEIEVFGGVS